MESKRSGNRSIVFLAKFYFAILAEQLFLSCLSYFFFFLDYVTMYSRMPCNLLSVATKPLYSSKNRTEPANLAFAFIVLI